MSGVNMSMTTHIDAAPETVWATLADVESWPTWTPTMTSVRSLRGEPRLGADFEVHQPKLPTATWEIALWEPPQRFYWVSKAMGVVTEAGHELEPAPDGGTRVTLTISQTGGLASLAKLMYGRLVREYVETEARSLKAHCEGNGPAVRGPEDPGGDRAAD
jgi:uncharacterized membrane protein